EAFDISADTAVLGFTLLTSGMIVGVGISGPTTTRLGLKRSYMIAMTLSLVPQFLIPFSPSFLLILALRFIQGLSILFIIPILVVTTEAWFKPPAKIGIATGLWVGALSLGGATGGIVAGALFPAVGWQVTYLVLGLVGAGLWSIWLSTVKMPQKAVSDVRRDAIVSKPPLKMRDTWLLSIALVGFTWPTYALLFNLPSYGYTLGFSPLEVGQLTFLMSIAGFVAGPIGGALVDVFTARSGNLKLGCAQTIIVGTILATSGVLLLPLIGPAGFGYFAVAALLAGLVWWMVVPLLTMPAALYPPEKLALGSGAITFVGNLPIAVAPAIVFSLALSSGWTAGWFLTALITTFGIWFVLPFLRSSH
ncbi:MAG: nitrate/nitrite transporter, partial [Candidatus Bathyarchaeia archaeon]